MLLEHHNIINAPVLSRATLRFGTKACEYFRLGRDFHVHHSRFTATISNLCFSKEQIDEFSFVPDDILVFIPHPEFEDVGFIAHFGVSDSGLVLKSILDAFSTRYLNHVHISRERHVHERYILSAEYNTFFCRILTKDQDVFFDKSDVFNIESILLDKLIKKEIFLTCHDEIVFSDRQRNVAPNYIDENNKIVYLSYEDEIVVINETISALLRANMKAVHENGVLFKLVLGDNQTQDRKNSWYFKIAGGERIDVLPHNVIERYLNILRPAGGWYVTKKQMAPTCFDKVTKADDSPASYYVYDPGLLLYNDHSFRGREYSFEIHGLCKTSIDVVKRRDELYNIMLDHPCAFMHKHYEFITSP